MNKGNKNNDRHPSYEFNSLIVQLLIFYKDGYED